MTARRSREEVESRLDEVRRLLRERHAGIEPDAHFVHRVIARLPRTPEWSLTWAARRILPVSVVLAMALVIAAVATNRAANRAVRSETVAAVQTEGDPLLWLLESGEERP